MKLAEGRKRAAEAGGGGAKLTVSGRNLLSEYKKLESYLSEVLSLIIREVIKLKISARNRLKGKVLSVEKDKITGKVKIEIKVPAVITAVITKKPLKIWT